MLVSADAMKASRATPLALHQPEHRNAALVASFKAGNVQPGGGDTVTKLGDRVQGPWKASDNGYAISVSYACVHINLKTFYFI